MPAGDDVEVTSRARLQFVLRLIVIAIVLALAVWGFIYVMSRNRAPTGVQAATPAALDVRVLEVRMHDIPIEPVFLGRTVASQHVEIRVRINGFIAERAFEEGAQVQEGQLLYRIDAKPFEAELAVARARETNARARLERADRQVQRLRQAA